jgi:hypothetical protein
MVGNFRQLCAYYLLPPEIGRNPKLIVGIVVVSVAVGIYIAEVVGVVVPWRSLPPINRKRQQQTESSLIIK